jgi:hypothetical protein
MIFHHQRQEYTRVLYSGTAKLTGQFLRHTDITEVFRICGSLGLKIANKPESRYSSDTWLIFFYSGGLRRNIKPLFPVDLNFTSGEAHKNGKPVPS